VFSFLKDCSGLVGIQQRFRNERQEKAPLKSCRGKLFELWNWFKLKVKMEITD